MSSYINEYNLYKKYKYREYALAEKERAMKEYFASLRYRIISTVIPSILVKENNEIEYIYPENVNIALKEINTLEKNYFNENDTM